MRRPFSIMRADAEEGWIEFLYKTVGVGTGRLARCSVGQTLSILGPIGKGFEPSPDRPSPVLIGGGVGIPPMIFLADILRRAPERYRPIVFMGSEIAFPFPAVPSQILVHGLPADAIACLPLLDDWGIPSRLASRRGFPGVYEGFVTDLARHWLEAVGRERRTEVEVFACGPTPMLAAVARLARTWELPCQVCLEEFMACAVGGCAGCTVRVRTGNRVTMQRVCVDGPVFPADAVFPD